ncbi:MAG: prolipoprotein diacylglyceryl transferase [Deltaproteobacteria bacterium]|nr:prolipoprotein diacylglyceryl transferase [Deltaproteobacteria bacterium]
MIWEHHLDPVILSLGPLQMRWYGLMYVVGFVAGFFVLRKLSREKILSLNEEQIDTMLFYIFVGLFLGARIFFVFVYNWPYYSDHPAEIIAFWRGGLSFHGGLLGFVIAFILLSRKFDVPFWNIADAACVAAPIGIAAVRIGNFMNGELYGRFTDGTWGVIFPEGGPMPRHPSQLYEAFFEGICLFVILFSLRGKLSQARLSALFLICYGIFRFGLEFFRQPDIQLGFVLLEFFSMGQVLCFLMIVSGCILWFYHRPLRSER